MKKTKDLNFIYVIELKIVLSLISILGSNNKRETISRYPLDAAIVNGAQLNDLISIPKMVINLNIIKKKLI